MNDLTTVESTKKVSRQFLTDPADITRVEAIRGRLSGQHARQREVLKDRLIENAIATYGLELPAPLIRRGIINAIPPKPFRVRHVWGWDIDYYPGLIPDRALLIYNQALASRAFHCFGVYEPRYGSQKWSRPHVTTLDPWLIGWTRQPYPANTFENLIERMDDRFRGIVLAYWN